MIHNNFRPQKFENYSLRFDAFSLVELSIVLVILGLLVGGVLSGQSLIRAAELRSVTEQQNQLATALNTFQSKYFALPGDMPNATQFWGSAGGSGSATDYVCYGAAASATVTGTCNGNGNGLIGLITVSGVDDGPEYEGVIVWKQLANAGLLNGSSYGQVSYSGGFGKLAGSGLDIYSSSAADSCSSRTYGIDTSNTFTLAPVNGAANGGSSIANALFTPADAWNIDTKVDDGLPGSGRWTAVLSVNDPNNTFGGSNSGVTSTSCTDVTGKYSLGNSAKLVNFRIRAL